MAGMKVVPQKTGSKSVGLPLESLSGTRQMDRLWDTFGDEHRCGAASLTAACVALQPEQLLPIVQRLQTLWSERFDEAEPRSEAPLAKALRDLRTGESTTESLQRLGDALFRLATWTGTGLFVDDL